jgi:hypothetical protein
VKTLESGHNDAFSSLGLLSPSQCEPAFSLPLVEINISFANGTSVPSVLDTGSQTMVIQHNLVQTISACINASRIVEPCVGLEGTNGAVSQVPVYHTMKFTKSRNPGQSEMVETFYINPFNDIDTYLTYLRSSILFRKGCSIPFWAEVSHDAKGGVCK